MAEVAISVAEVAIQVLLFVRMSQNKVPTVPRNANKRQLRVHLSHHAYTQLAALSKSEHRTVTAEAEVVIEKYCAAIKMATPATEMATSATVMAAPAIKVRKEPWDAIKHFRAFCPPGYDPTKVDRTEAITYGHDLTREERQYERNWQAAQDAGVGPPKVSTLLRNLK